MINKFIGVGRVTKDIELKKTNNDISVASFTLAINRPYKNQAGENEADFINCQCWRQTADNVAKYVSKGSLIGVEGRVQVRTYQDKEDNTRYVTEVVCDNVQFLDTKPKEESPQLDKQEDVKKMTEEDLPF